MRPRGRQPMLPDRTDSRPRPSRRPSPPPSDLAGKAEWIVALALLMYPLLGTLVAFTTLPSLAASLPVRAAVLLLALRLIAAARSAVWASTPARLIFAFWLIYFLRIAWDLLVAGVPVARDFMFTFTVFCIPPALAMLQAPAMDERRLTKLLLLLGCITCLLAAVAANTGLAGDRSTTEEAEGRLFLDTVNPITFGNVGVVTMLAALSRLRFCARPVDWLTAIAGAMLGLMSIQLGGSRGPLVALVVCTLIVMLFERRYRWLLLPMAAAGWYLFGATSSDSQSLLAARLAETAQDADNPEIRVLMIAGAIQQFVDSPLVGSAIVERNFQDYPHNPFIEAAMATGIFGLLLIIAIHVNAIRHVARALRGGAVMLPLLAIHAMVAAQFSGSLSASAPHWLMLALFSGAGARAARRGRRAAAAGPAPGEARIGGAGP